MASTSDSTAYEPSLFELLLGILLSLTLGILLAGVVLSLRPVEIVQAPPAEPEAGAVYYVRGSANSQVGRMWQSKQQAFVDQVPGQIEFIEDELNLWARSALKEAPSNGKEPSSWPTLKLGTPNFRIQQGQLQISFEADLMVYGTQRVVVIQGTGTIESTGEGFAYVLSDFWIGSLHASRLPLVGNFLAKRFFGAQALPEGLAAPWQALSKARVDGRQVVLKRP